MKANFVVSHPTGNNFVRALVEELFKAEKLENFFTTIGFGYDAITRRLVKNRKRLRHSGSLNKKTSNKGNYQTFQLYLWKLFKKENSCR